MTNNCKHSVTVSFIVAIMCSTTACSSETVESVRSPIQQTSQLSTATPMLAENSDVLVDLLDERIPLWNDSVIAGKTNSIALSISPPDIAAIVNDSIFYYDRKIDNNITVFRSIDNKAIYRYNMALGYWKYIKDTSDTSNMDPSVDAKRAEELIGEFFGKIGLSKDEKGPTLCNGVTMAAEKELRTVAWRAEVRRAINGREVIDSHVRVYYKPNGDIFRAEIKWPKFNLKRNYDIIDRDKAIDEIATEINTAIGAIKDVEASIVYCYDEDANDYEPAIRMHFTRNESVDGEPVMDPVEIRYSLLRGILRTPRASEVTGIVKSDM